MEKAWQLFSLWPSSDQFTLGGGVAQRKNA
jgi:hypothetical protein